MILERKFAPRLSTKATVAVALFGILVIPSFVQTTVVKAGSGSTAAAPATDPIAAENPAESEFPYAVRFEQGATQFADGDQITITEIRGTALTFAPGNIYWIKGRYTLGSHAQAMLAAFTTAMDAENGRGPYLKVQTAMVDRGHGTFTLFLPMSSRGWPHVSFYPAKGAEVSAAAILEQAIRS